MHCSMLPKTMQDDMFVKNGVLCACKFGEDSPRKSTYGLCTIVTTTISPNAIANGPSPCPTFIRGVVVRGAVGVRGSLCVGLWCVCPQFHHT